MRVCEYHQTAKLLASGLRTKTDYKELLISKTTVCEIGNRNCVLHGCEKYPGNHVLKTFLIDLFEKEDEKVYFKQWKNNVIRQCD